jgi:hypothetical protein
MGDGVDGDHLLNRTERKMERWDGKTESELTEHVIVYIT